MSERKEAVHAESVQTIEMTGDTPKPPSDDFMAQKDNFGLCVLETDYIYIYVFVVGADD